MPKNVEETKKFLEQPNFFMVFEDDVVKPFNMSSQNQST
jgi:hypothetical protein